MLLGKIGLLLDAHKACLWYFEKRKALLVWLTKEIEDRAQICLPSLGSRETFTDWIGKVGM